VRLSSFVTWPKNVGFRQRRRSALWISRNGCEWPMNGRGSRERQRPGTAGSDASLFRGVEQMFTLALNASLTGGESDEFLQQRQIPGIKDPRGAPLQMRGSTKARLSHAGLYPRANHTHVSMPVRGAKLDRGSRVGHHRCLMNYTILRNPPSRSHNWSPAQRLPSAASRAGSFSNNGDNSPSRTFFEEARMQTALAPRG
jgi:hypothetical protein